MGPCLKSNQITPAICHILHSTSPNLRSSNLPSSKAGFVLQAPHLIWRINECQFFFFFFFLIYCKETPANRGKMQCQTFHVFLGSSQDFAFQICAQVTWYVPNQGICSTYSAPFPFGALLTPPPPKPQL